MAIVKVMSDDPRVNRSQDNIRDTVNPLISRTAALRTEFDATKGDVSNITTRVVDLENGEQNGNVTWDDIQGPALSAGGASAVVIEAYGDTPYLGAFYRHDRDDVQSFQYQLPHRWNRGEVRMHAHIVPMADPAAAQVVKLSGRYTWARYGVATSLWANWTTFDVSHTVNPGDIRKPTIVPLFSTTPTGAKESDFLLMYFMRPGSSDAADTYTTSKPGSGTAAANLCLLTCDVHYQVDKTGTATEIPA